MNPRIAVLGCGYWGKNLSAISTLLMSSGWSAIVSKQAGPSRPPGLSAPNPY
jgi:hypothetical protein